jgi:hypothetical protein
MSPAAVDNPIAIPKITPFTNFESIETIILYQKYNSLKYQKLKFYIVK